MPANTNPIFTSTPVITWSDLGSTVFITTVNTGTGTTAYDGTTNVNLVFTGGANGSFLQKLILESGGGNAVSVLRVHINNGGSTATADNNTLIMQYNLPLTTASSTLATAHIEVPINIQIPNGYRVYVSLGAIANLASGWAVTAIGGNY